MEKFTYQDYRNRISIIDVAKAIGYSDRTQWAKEKKSSANPCLQNASGDQIIISHPNNLSKQLYFNPQDTSDKGDLITFVKRKLNLDTKGINEYLTSFLTNQPLIKNTRPEWDMNGSIETPDKEFKAFYFQFSDLTKDNLAYLFNRGITAESLTSNAFKGFFKSVKIPVFRNGKMVSHSDESFVSVQHREKMYGPVTGVDYRNAEIHKHGVSSKKSTSVGISNVPANVDHVFIAESGIDAISHYQHTKPGNKVVYIVTGGNLTIGQLKAIEGIQKELEQDSPIKTTLLFDNDQAGAMYDLKFIVHTVNRLNDADILHLEHNKETVTIEINVDPLPVKISQALLSAAHQSKMQVNVDQGQLNITVNKDFSQMRSLSDLLIKACSIEDILHIEKSPVLNDWNDVLKSNTQKNEQTFYHGTGYDLQNTTFSSEMNSRGVGGNSFTLGNGVYLTDHLPAARLFSHLSLQKKMFLSGEDFHNAGTGNIYSVGIAPTAKILDATVPLKPDAVRVILNKYKEQHPVQKENTKEYSDALLSDVHQVAELLLKLLINAKQNPYELLVKELGYDGMKIKEPRWQSWDYYPRHLDVHPEAFAAVPTIVIVYNPDQISTLKPLITSPVQNQINTELNTQHTNDLQQDANPAILSPTKNKTMSQTNAGEQTQKTASEKLEGVMKSLGLKEVWDQVAKSFQAWADGAETGRKSFTFENKTFRRTGFADAERNISTDMIADIALNFNKNDKGVFFNSYTVDLKNSIINGIKPEKRGSVKDTFEISLKKDESANNLTIKKAMNLLDGRSVSIGENNWIKRNGSDVVEYKFDLEKAIKENQHIDFSATNVEHMESAIESLKKGDFALIGCAIDNKPVHIFLTADAQYKKVEAHDNTLYRHLSEAEQAQIKENMNHKQDQVQGAKQHP
jgi:hypothetical protein